jgi:hypothetical protein
LLAEINQSVVTAPAGKTARQIFIFFNQLFFNYFY